MSTYLKNMAGYKHSQLKSKSYDEIQKLFNKEIRVNTFVDMNSEVVKGRETRTEESFKRAGDELEFDMSKKQKIDKHVEVEKDDQKEAEMKRHIEIVKDDEVAIDAIPLATKPPVIVEYKIDKDGRMRYFKLIRADGSSKRWQRSSTNVSTRIHHTSSNGLRKLFQLLKKAIKRLKQGESINVQDLKTNLYWEFGKFTSLDGESLESYYLRFYNMMNELVKNTCDVTNHQVNVQFLLQLQPEWQSDTGKEEEQSQTKRKYSNTSSTTDEQPNKRRCKAEKFEAIQYSLGPNKEYIAIRSYEYDIWERNEDNLSIIYQDIFKK
ncbi:hypothetical protein Tco_1209953 [Tanacetum coccineum]